MTIFNNTFKEGDCVTYGVTQNLKGIIVNPAVTSDNTNEFFGDPEKYIFTVEDVWDDTIKLSRIGTTQQVWCESKYFSLVPTRSTAKSSNDVLNLLPFFMELTKYKVSSSYIHQWPSYRKATVLCNDEEEYMLDIAFDTGNMLTISMCIWDNKRNRIFNWVNELYRQDVMIDYNKFKQHNDEFEEIHVELLSDFQEKARAIVEGKDYDERIIVEIELDEKSKLKLFELAHEHDMSLNQFIEKIIIDSNNDYSK